MFLKNSLNDFWLVKNYIWSIENYIRSIQQRSRGDWTRQIQTKILIAISIGRETDSINLQYGKIIFLKNRAILLCRNFSKHSILWIKCMSMRWNAFQKHYLPKKFQSIFLKFLNFKHILHYNEGIFNLGWPKQDHTQ